MLTISARKLDSLLRDWRNDAPAYGALADRLRLLMLDGRIPVGGRLPAERELAQQLGVSRTTVSATYARLRDSGYLSSMRGSGSIAQLPGNHAAAHAGTGTGILDFSKAAMPAAPELAEAAVRSAQELPVYLSGSGYDPVGLPRLREAIAERYRIRGLPTDPAQVMVTVGAQHAIALLSRTLLDRSDSALVESPSYPHAYDAIRAVGRRLVPVNVTTDEGWDDDGVEQAFLRTNPTIAYVMPDFHNPTGQVMGAGQRERLLSIASRQGTVVIADETMAELSIDDVDSELPLAAYGPAVLIGSLGKTVWGGLRIGWIRAEPALIQRLVRTRSANDLGTPILEQIIAADLLGGYDRILAGRAEQLRYGREHLRRALNEALPEWDVPHVAGGLAVWVNLGRPVSSQLTLAARSQNLLLAAGPRFGIDGAFERFLRIPFSYPAEETDRAVKILARAWESLSDGPTAELGYLAAVV